MTRQYLVCALYKFVTLDDYVALKAPLLQKMLEYQIKGTLLLAKEGINGTITGSKENVDRLLDYLKTDTRLADLICKMAYHSKHPFYRTKVKLKKEIVTLGVEGIDPNHLCGTYVKPKEWNALISDPDVLLIDTRNHYEVAIGTFKDTVDPDTESFREFPRYVNANLDKAKHKKIAMFCTGGIRCEKSTAYLKALDFEDVYHLEGGILKYLEEIPEEESLWQGECFVFDTRVAVDHHLTKGHYDQCFACRMPITEDDKQKSEYQKGASYHHCINRYSDERKNRFQEHQKQIHLAKDRNEIHLGS